MSIGRSINGGFRSRGFYLHACWMFAHPFAVRSWSRQDFQGMFELLNRMGYDRVMLWPMLDIFPPGLSAEDRASLARQRQIIADARASGLECWITLTPNLTVRDEIRKIPIDQRHFYPFKEIVRLDQPDQRARYFEHRAAMLGVLNNADAYVTIDGDPGGWSGAEPSYYTDVLEFDRETIRRAGDRPGKQRIVSWLWSGWGNHWAERGCWNEPLEPLIRPVLRRLKDEVRKDIHLLAGRSGLETAANGRQVIAMTEEEGLLDRSTLLLYEAVEYEPTQPVAVNQFALIRDAIRRELPYADVVDGCFANAQQPIASLHNAFYFSRASSDPSELDRDDRQVLKDYAAFLGVPADVLAPAVLSLELDVAELRGVADALRTARCNPEIDRCLPGGFEPYRNFLVQQVSTRVEVETLCRQETTNAELAGEILASATRALVLWWRVTRYVLSGEEGDQFRWKYVHPYLTAPLRQWVLRHLNYRHQIGFIAASRLSDEGILSRDSAYPCLMEMLDV